MASRLTRREKQFQREVFLISNGCLGYGVEIDRQLDIGGIFMDCYRTTEDNSEIPSQQRVAMF
jgi:hypothetical protein